jgi:hypothetical protein
VSRRIVFPVTGTLDDWKEVLRPTSSDDGRRTPHNCIVEPDNQRKANPRWPYWQSWMSSGADHQKEPSSN